MKVTVLGCGRWGSFQAWYSARLGHDTMLWGRPSSKALTQLMETRKNEYLELEDSIVLTDDLDRALSHAELIIISIGAQGLRDLLEHVAQYPVDGIPFVLCMKGIEIQTGKRLSEVFEDVMGERASVGVWLGPGHVQDFVKGVPNCMVVDSKSQELKELVVKQFGSELIRFYYGDDLIGNEIGAAYKNVIGIAAGMLDGMHLTSLKGALMARAPREVARLICALGGCDRTAYGLAHLGDYEATLFSQNSHNRRFGEEFIQGRNFGKLAEGVPTLHAIHGLAQRMNLDLPICAGLYSVIIEGLDIQTEMGKLFLRPLKEEFYH